MSKAILMSIQPKWCALIADGYKTVEVRKSRPKFETPFKVYIYCTKDKENCGVAQGKVIGRGRGRQSYRNKKRRPRPSAERRHGGHS